MTTAYSNLMGLALPVQGELSGTWGDTVNNGITNYLDVALAGTQTISGSQTAVTLSLTNGDASGTNLSQVGSGSTGSAQYAIINCTGNPAGLLTITVPASSRQYTIINATSTSQSVKIVGAGPTTGVTVASGERATVVWNGSDFVKVATSTAGTGTLTAVSVATANGFAGTSSGGATPTLTLTTSVTGLLKGNGTALSAATAGTDYVAPATATTFTATQTFSGSSSALGAVLTDTAEVATVSATAATGTINYDVTTQSVIYYTSDAAANWTVNFRGSSGTSLNTLLATGQSITVAFLVTQGATAYYNNTVQVDGTTSGVTMRWLGGAPTAGNASGIDSYRYLIIKTGSATYTILASVTQFKA